jgi:hypothetical protein
LARAKLNGKAGYIDTEGKWVIDPIFDMVPSSFTGDLAMALKDGLWGLIDLSGKWVIEPHYALITLI